MNDVLAIAESARLSALLGRFFVGPIVHRFTVALDGARLVTILRSCVSLLVTGLVCRVDLELDFAEGCEAPRARS